MYMKRNTFKMYLLSGFLCVSYFLFEVKAFAHFSPIGTHMAATPSNFKGWHPTPQKSIGNHPQTPLALLSSLTSRRVARDMTTNMKGVAETLRWVFPGKLISDRCLWTFHSKPTSAPCKLRRLVSYAKISSFLIVFELLWITAQRRTPDRFFHERISPFYTWNVCGRTWRPYKTAPPMYQQRKLNKY